MAVQKSQNENQLICIFFIYKNTRTSSSYKRDNVKFLILIRVALNISFGW